MLAHHIAAISLMDIEPPTLLLCAGATNGTILRVKRGPGSLCLGMNMC